MSLAQQPSWQVFDLAQPDPVRGRGTGTLIRTSGMDVFRLQLSAGQSQALDQAETDTLVYCLGGRVSVHLPQCECEVSMGQMLYLPPGEPHELRGTENSVLLIITCGAGPRSSMSPVEREQLDVGGGERDAVQEASEESFPASDPPGWAPLASS